MYLRLSIEDLAQRADPLLAGSRYWRTLNLALNEFRYLPGSGTKL
jgi:hypothetical protein